MSYEIRHILNYKILMINKKNIEIQDSLIEELKSQFMRYIITMCFILLFFVVLLYALIFNI